MNIKEQIEKKFGVIVRSFEVETRYYSGTDVFLNLVKNGIEIELKIPGVQSQRDLIMKLAEVFGYWRINL